MRTLIVLIGILLATQGCRGPAGHVQDAPPAALPAGWKLHQAGNMTMGLPSDWMVKNLTKQDASAFIDVAGQGDAQSKKIAEFMRQAGDQVNYRLMAFPPIAPGAQFASNVNVIEEEMPSRLSLEEVRAANVTTIERLAPNSGLKHELVKTPIGQAVKLDFESNPALRLRSIGYVFVKDRTSTVVTFTVSDGVNLPIQQIIDTVRIK